MEAVDVRVLLAPAISFACSGLVFLMGRNVFWRRFWSLGAASLKFVVVLSMLPAALAGKTLVWNLIEFTPGIGIGFRADALGMFFALVSSALWLITTVYAIGYMEPEHAKVRFFGFFALCVSTTVGVAFAENLLTLFVFYETLTICTYPLVIHEETPEALRAGRKYLAYTLSGGACILLGAALTYQVAGTLTLSKPGIIPASADVRTLAVLFATLIAGFGVKAAVMPLHGWLPSAMVAPTPVSALLHAVAVVKVGAFGVLRVVYNIFGVELLKRLGFATPLAYLAAFTIIAGSVAALFQDNLKRRLAYSTVSQLSYIVLGAALLTPASASAAVAHIANQAFAKITMFFAAGAIQRTTGKTQVHELGGIGKQMPLTMAAFTVASLSFVGMPLTGGFITKWYLSVGAFESGMWWFALVMVASSLLNAAYWLPIVYLAYLKGPQEVAAAPREAKPSLLVPAVACAVWVLVLGTTSDVPGMPFALARAAVEFVFKM